MTVEIPEPGSVWVHGATSRRYLILSIGREEETQELAVVYQEQGNPDGPVWIRALSDFLAYPKDSAETRFRPYDSERDEAF